MPDDTSISAGVSSIFYIIHYILAACLWLIAIGYHSVVIGLNFCSGLVYLLLSFDFGLANSGTSNIQFANLNFYGIDMNLPRDLCGNSRFGFSLNG